MIDLERGHSMSPARALSVTLHRATTRRGRALVRGAAGASLVERLDGDATDLQ